MEGLPGQGRRSLQAYDARRRRVHPPLSDPRPTRRISSHPSLRFVCQRQPDRQYRIGPSAPRRTRSSSVRRRSRRRPRGSRTRRAERLSLLRRAHDYHRDLRTRLPAAVVAYPVDRARQFMTMTPLHPPTPLPPNVAISPAAPTLRRQRPSTPPSADKTWSTEYPITVPNPSRAAKTGARLVAQPSSCPEPTNQIKQRRQIPHRPTPASVRTPPRFPPSRLFGRLPPCTPSRLCLAAVRKPLTRGGLQAGFAPQGGLEPHGTMRS